MISLHQTSIVMEFMELGCGGGDISKILTLHVFPGSAFTESMINVASFVTAEDSRTASATTAAARTIKILADIFLRIRLEVRLCTWSYDCRPYLKASTRVSTVNGIWSFYFFYISIASSNRMILHYQSLSWTLVRAVAEETIRAGTQTTIFCTFNTILFVTQQEQNIS